MATDDDATLFDVGEGTDLATAIVRLLVLACECPPLGVEDEVAVIHAAVSSDNTRMMLQEYAFYGDKAKAMRHVVDEAFAPPVVPLDVQGPAHRTDDHHTSVGAALSHLGARANQRSRLATVFFYEALRGGGLTDEEAARRANILKGSPWKRCTDLRRGYWLEPTGETRATETGDQAKVWRMTSRGVIAFRRALDERAVS